MTIHVDFAVSGAAPFAHIKNPSLVPSKGDIVVGTGEKFKVDEVQWRLAENRVVIICKEL